MILSVLQTESLVFYLQVIMSFGRKAREISSKLILFTVAGRCIMPWNNLFMSIDCLGSLDWKAWGQQSIVIAFSWVDKLYPCRFILMINNGIMYYSIQVACKLVWVPIMKKNIILRYQVIFVQVILCETIVSLFHNPISLLSNFLEKSVRF